MKYIVLGLATMLFVLGASHAQAATYTSNQSGTLTVSASPVSKPLYVAGDAIVVSAPIDSDVYAAGNSIKVNAGVSENVFAAASTVTIDTDVKKSVTVLAGDTTINGTVSQDLNIVGGTTTISKTAHVLGDIHVLGGQLTVDGVIDGSVYYAGPTLQINGVVSGNIQAMATSVIVADTATVGGNLTYEGKNDAFVAPGAVKGTITHHPQAGGYQSSKFFQFASMLLVGALLILLFGGKIKRIAKTFTVYATRNSLVGLLFVIVIPIVALVLAITFIGMPVSLVLFSLYCMMLYFATPIASIIIGDKIVGLLKIRVSEKLHLFVSFVIGLIAWYILSLIPYFGPIVMAVVWLMTVGAMLVFDVDLYSSLREKHEL